MLRILAFAPRHKSESFVRSSRPPATWRHVPGQAQGRSRISFGGPQQRLSACPASCQRAECVFPEDLTCWKRRSCRRCFGALWAWGHFACGEEATRLKPDVEESRHVIAPSLDRSYLTCAYSSRRTPRTTCLSDLPSLAFPTLLRFQTSEQGRAPRNSLCWT